MCDALAMARTTPRAAAAPRRLSPLLLASVALLGTLTPCCTTASAVALQPGRVTVQTPLQGTVRVDAVGSSRRAGIGPRAVRSEDLAHAVRGTLLASNACQGVVESGAADHVLRVEIVDIVGSELQLDMEAAVVARWTLFDPTGRVASWQETITTHGKANTFDAGMVEDRARMALEQATRTNITEGVTRLGRRAVSPE
jgi:hypothetical protein